MKRHILSLALAVAAWVGATAYNTVNVYTQDTKFSYDMADVYGIYHVHSDIDPAAPLTLVVECKGETMRYSMPVMPAEESYFYQRPQYEVSFEAPESGVMSLWLEGHDGSLYGAIQPLTEVSEPLSEDYSEYFVWWSVSNEEQLNRSFGENAADYRIAPVQFYAWGGTWTVQVEASLSDGDWVDYTMGVRTSPRPELKAWLNARDKAAFSLESNQNTVEIPVYRSEENCSEPLTVAVALADVNDSNASDYITAPSEVTFAAGQSTAAITLTVATDRFYNGQQVDFKLDLGGFSVNPKLSRREFSIEYVKEWIPIPNCQLLDNTLFQPFGGDQCTWEVEVYSHPVKTGMLRVRAPYATGPFSYMYNYDAYPENWLYINATNPGGVYFSDNAGNPEIWYNTGCYCNNDTNFAEDYGFLMLGCYYSAYLNYEDMWFGSAGCYYWTSAWANRNGYFGKTESPNGLPCGIVSFGSNLAVQLSGLPNYGDLNSSQGNWELWLNGATNEEWIDMGMATYTDGFLAQFYPLLYGDSESIPSLTYDVPVQHHRDNPEIYRLVNPYSSEYWQYGYNASEHAADCNIKVDCSNPDMVLVDWQTAYPAENGDDAFSICNAATFYMLYTAGSKMTQEEIMAEGLNDVKSGNTITINHPLTFYGYSGAALWLEPNFIPAVIVLPEARMAPRLQMPAGPYRLTAKPGMAPTPGQARKAAKAPARATAPAASPRDINSLQPAQHCMPVMPSIHSLNR